MWFQCLHIILAASAVLAQRTRLGLLAPTLGKDPTGEILNGNNGQFQNNNGGQSGQFRELPYCCSTSSNVCPTAQGGFLGIDPRKGQPEIGNRIANLPSGNFQQSRSSCRPNLHDCCYETQFQLDSVAQACSSGSFGNERFVPKCGQSNPRQGRGQCGTRSFNQLRNLPRGHASPGEFPWTCLILVVGTDRLVGSCSIIPDNLNNDISHGTNKVLTVAHKVSGGNIGQNEGIKVRVIEYNAAEFDPNVESQPHQEFLVTKINTHPQFNSKRLSNDIAILELDGFIDLQGNNDVNAACLPTCNRMFDHTFSNGTGPRCWVAGWGKECPTCEFSFILRKTDVPLVDDSTCQCELRNALDRKNGGQSRLEVHRSEICAGGEPGKDACDGDGGAPLVCEDPRTRQWYVVGLVAWGVGCAQPNVPGVYCRVDSFLDGWLGSQLRRSGRG